MAVTTVQATEKGALNSEAAIALAKYIMESRLEKARELVDLQQQVQANQEKAEFAQRKLNELTVRHRAGPSATPSSSWTRPTPRPARCG